MQAINYYDLKKIGHVVRKQLEAAQAQHEELDWSRTLCGACATGSYLILQILKRKGIPSQIISGSHQNPYWGGHAWLETEDFLIDVTYTQFYGQSPKVLLCRKGSRRYKLHHRNFPDASPTTMRELKTWGPQCPKQVLSVIKRKRKSRK